MAHFAWNLEVNTCALRHALAWTPDPIPAVGQRRPPKPLEGCRQPEVAEKVGVPIENLKNLAVHPEGKQLVFDAATEEPRGEIWVLEDFLLR
jgi:hypothetical protein